MKAKVFKSKNTTGLTSKTIVGIDEDGSVLIRQIGLCPKDMYVPDCETLLRMGNSYALTKRKCLSRKSRWE